MKKIIHIIQRMIKKILSKANDYSISTNTLFLFFLAFIIFGLMLDSCATNQCMKQKNYHHPSNSENIQMTDLNLVNKINADGLFNENLKIIDLKYNQEQNTLMFTINNISNKQATFFHQCIFLDKHAMPIDTNPQNNMETIYGKQTRVFKCQKHDDRIVDFKLVLSSKRR